MARCSVAGRTSAVPTTLRGPSVYSTAALKPRIREVGVFNTTATAVAVGLARASPSCALGSASPLAPRPALGRSYRRVAI